MSESNETAGLELGDYIRIFRKSWLLILICTVLGAVGAGAFSKMATPLYQASASTYVSVRSADSAGVGELAQGGYYASWAVSSYVDVIESAIVLKPVIDDLNLDMTTAELAGMVSASAPGAGGLGEAVTTCAIVA